MLEFEWDEAKRLSNLEKHDIDFVRARSVFDGRDVFNFALPFISEWRFGTTGILDDVFVTIIWTRRGNKIRIISVRRARREERRKHSQLYGCRD